MATPQTRWEISPRFDVAFGTKNTLTARLQYESGSRSSRGGATSLPTIGNTTSDSEITLQVSDSQLVSERVINETRFEYQHTPSSSSPLSTAAQINVAESALRSGNGLLVAGNRYTVTGPGAPASGRTVTQFWTKAQ